MVPVPVFTKTWHYPQPQLAKLPCDLPQRDAGPGREFCAQICFGLGFFVGFHLESKTPQCSGVGSFPLEKRLSWLLLCSELEHLKADLLKMQESPQLSFQAMG